MQPWPTAYTFFHRPGKEPMRVIVSRLAACIAIGTRSTSGPPPERSSARDRDKPIARLSAATADDVLEILELQPAGKKRMTAEEFLRGYPIQEGYRFGPERLP